MTKKFISLVLSLALVIGLLPAMGVQAEAVEPVPYLTENFEGFSNNSVFNPSMTTATTLIDSNGRYRFSMGKHLKAEIITMNGYDGNPTQVVDIYVNSSVSVNTGATRFNYNRNDENRSYANPTTGKYVVEFKIYVPQNENDETRSMATYIASPAIIKVSKDAVEFGIGTGTASSQHDMYFTGEKGTWYKLTYVFEYGVMREGDWANAGSLYVNDVLKGYREDIYGYANSNGGGKNLSLGSYINFYSWGVSGADKREKLHIIFDDFNYYVPGTTTSTSTFDGNNSVKKSADIKVDFNNMLLNAKINDEYTVTSDCVAMSDAAGNAVEIESVNVSSDNKSLIINPKNQLAEGTEYSVTVSNLTDMYMQPIDSYSFTFKTVEPSPITVSQPVFTKENLFVAGGASRNITTLENGYIKAAGTVSNSSNAAKDVMVLAMLKEGNDIKYFQFDNIAVPANGSANFSGGFQVDDASAQNIEIVVWDSITSKTPIADKYAFSSSGLVKTDLDTLLGE